MTDQVKPILYFSMLLDRSGSMTGVLNETIDGVNSFIKRQKEDENYEIIFSLSQFDHEYEVLKNAENVKFFKELSKENYIPRGWTALRDSVSRCIGDAKKYLSSLKEERKPAKVLIVIITDGEENSSKEVSDSEVRELIKDCQDNLKWEIIFLSSDIKATTTARDIYAMKGNSVANFDRGNEGNVYTNFCSSVDEYKSSNFRNAVSKCCDWEEIDLTKINDINK